MMQKKVITCWVWWCLPVIPGLGRQRWLDLSVKSWLGLHIKFQASQGNTVKPYLTKTTTKSFKKKYDQIS